MTFLEKFREEHPGFHGDDETIVKSTCPEDFGYEKRGPDCVVLGIYGEVCVACWNREVGADGV